MEIIRLQPGRHAPSDADCISLNRLSDGRCDLTGAVLDGEESVSMVAGTTYGSVEEAEAAGLAWADEHHVRVLHVAVAGC